MRVRHFLLPAALTLALLLQACAPAQPEQAAAALSGAQDAVAGAIEDPAEDAQASIAEVTTAVVVAAQASVQEVLPPVAAPAPRLPAAATRLIVRWEVSSPAYYAKRLTRPIWPGGSSGATCCIGYDAGHQTAATIRADFADHPGVQRWASAAGVVGTPARALARSLQDLQFDYAYAIDVFDRSTLPRYHAAARRALGPDFELLPEDAQGSLDSTGYNRGWAMLGPNRREMREIRDVCVPARDVHCIAAQQRSMCRLWVGTPLERGLCDRREDEARTSEGSA